MRHPTVSFSAGILPALAGLALIALSVQAANGQVFNLTRDQLIRYTAQNPFDRFPDGRPKVPDAVLEKVRGLSAEEVLSIARHGFNLQFSDGFQVLHPGKKLVGRALTVQLMPMRPDIDNVNQEDRKAKGLGRLSHQSAIDMLQPGDVFVVDAFGSIPSGGIIGDNLAYYIWKTTGAGFVIDGAIRDLEGIANYDMAGYFRGATPPAIRNLMVTGINIPVRIGNTTVMPGDVVLGDREGVFFIPPNVVQEVIDEADVTHIHDEWTRMKFDQGKYKSTDIYGRPSDPALIKEYEDYLKQKLGAARYEQYQKRRPGPGAGPRRPRAN
ncbi:MAG: dimethylmenaquinone methyltransferase [Bryobacterales bacterium]|nr:dimethylmenaquinone methyltransferase [Bryobacterales bacterium]